MKTSSYSIIKEITRLIAEEFFPEKIILFGSYVNGNQDNDSDIDLLIIKNTDERFIDRWTSVRKILSDPNRKIGVDTLVLTPQEINERLYHGDQFIADIIENGEILYAR
jgi:predicted nucleotidyltransferase